MRVTAEEMGLRVCWVDPRITLNAWIGRAGGGFCSCVASPLGCATSIFRRPSAGKTCDLCLTRGLGSRLVCHNTGQLWGAYLVLAANHAGWHDDSRANGLKRLLGTKPRRPPPLYDGAGTVFRGGQICCLLGFLVWLRNVMKSQ